MNSSKFTHTSQARQSSVPAHKNSQTAVAGCLLLSEGGRASAPATMQRTSTHAVCNSPPPHTQRHPPNSTATHSLLRCEEGVGARRSEGMPDCSNSSSPLLRLMRPVRHTSITPNLLSTRCMATVCGVWQGVTASGSREAYVSPRQHMG